MHDVTHKIPGHTVVEHYIDVPLDYRGIFTSFSPEEKKNVPHTIEVFAREYIRDGGEHFPRLVFFQGGPGFAAPRPAPISGWIDTALQHYRVVLLDERGTGNSHPIEAEDILAVGHPEIQAAFISCFRQDSIIHDAELMREALEEKQWAVMGQSFGGFTVTSYLSFASSGISEALITAGLPSIDAHADDVYKLTYFETDKRNREYFERYPDDEAIAWRITTHLADVEETLPTGERLTPGRFRQIGINLGRSYGLESIHHLINNPFYMREGTRRLRPQFLRRMGDQASLAASPLYGVMHEAIYAQASSGATSWSAHRVRGEFPSMRLPDLALGGKGEEELRAEGHGFRFTGEHMYPWQMREDPALSPIVDAADILAHKTDLPALYDAEGLAEARVPSAAWVYTPDMFVPFSLSMETAKIGGIHTIVSEVFHHDALSTGGPQMVEKLVEAVRKK